MATGAAERDALVAELFGGGVPSLVASRFLRTREVALLFQVSERAVTDWARKGRIPSVRTPGGHRRYPADQVRALLAAAEEGVALHDDPATSLTDASPTEVEAV